MDDGCVKPRVGEVCEAQILIELLRRTDELWVSARGHSLLLYLKRQHGVEYLGDLVSFTRAEILSIPKIGKRTVDELDGRLRYFGLEFGMGWRPRDVDELAKRYEWYY